MRWAALAFALALACGPAAARAADPVAAFTSAWAAVNDYTATITTHEIDAKGIAQDRVYHYAYLKPHFAKIDVVSGPGRGSGAVWSGGDTVRGHQGGMLSGVKMSVSIHDSRATSLRGDTIDAGMFAALADAFKNDKTASAPGATIAGVATDAVSIELLPGTSGGATRLIVYFSPTTHMPVRRVTYAGDTLVKQEDFSELKLNTGLTEANFT